MNSYPINQAEEKWLRSLARMNKINSVLEFGPGKSTAVWLETCGGPVVSIEKDPHKKEQMLNKFGHFGRWWSPPYPPRGERYDMAFVDGPAGTPRYSRLASLMAAAELTDLMILHDFGRLGEWESGEVLQALGWEITRAQIERGKAQRAMGVFTLHRSVIIPDAFAVSFSGQGITT